MRWLAILWHNNDIYIYLQFINDVCNELLQLDLIDSIMLKMTGSYLGSVAL
jgi:hypothetical protein